MSSGHVACLKKIARLHHLFSSQNEFSDNLNVVEASDRAYLNM